MFSKVLIKGLIRTNIDRFRPFSVRIFSVHAFLVKLISPLFPLARFLVAGLLSVSLNAQAGGTAGAENSGRVDNRGGLNSYRLIISPAIKYKWLAFDQVYPSGLGSFDRVLKGGVDVVLPMVSLTALV